jgi:hypothetical protein
MSLNPSYTIDCNDCRIQATVVFYGTVPSNDQAQQDAVITYFNAEGWEIELSGISQCPTCRPPTEQEKKAAELGAIQKIIQDHNCRSGGCD